MDELTEKFIKNMDEEIKRQEEWLEGLKKIRDTVSKMRGKKR